MKHKIKAPLPAPDDVALGLDYLRLSYELSPAVRRPLGDIMADRARELADRIYGAGRYNVASAAYASRRGVRAGRHVAIVTDGERITEIVSGVGAREWRPPKYEIMMTSIRRVDVAADMIYRCATVDEAIVLVDNLIQDLYDHYIGMRLARTKGWVQREITLMRGFEGATLYLGKRASERMLRVYNKTAQLKEQQIEDTRGILRVELELKDRGVKLADTEYLLTGDVKAYVMLIASYITTAYGIQLPTTVSWHAPYNPRLDDPEWARTLEWFRRRVFPSLRRLYEIVPDEIERMGVYVKGDTVGNYDMDSEQVEGGDNDQTEE